MESNGVMSLMSVWYGPCDRLVVMNECQRWKTDVVDQVVNHNQLCDWSMGMVFVLNLVMILWRKTLLSLKGSSLMEDHVVMNWSSSDARPFNFVVVNNNCQQQFSFSWITKNTRSWTLLRMQNNDQNFKNHQQQKYNTDSWLNCHFVREMFCQIKGQLHCQVQHFPQSQQYISTMSCMSWSSMEKH